MKFNIKKIRIMRTETTAKEHYEVPKIEIYETVNEGIICTSDPKSTSASDFKESGTYGDGTDIWGN